MNLLAAVKHLERTFRSNSPAILTGLGVSGAITTAVLTGKASYQAATKLNKLDDVDYLSTKEKVAMVWTMYIPAAVSGVVTVGCILASNHVHSKRVATAYSLLAVTENAFVEYREKIIEQIGEKKEQEARDAIAQERVTKNPPKESGIIVATSGDVLCYEMFTGRYFKSDMESLRRAENDINAKLVREMWVTLSEFYYLVNLPFTSQSTDIGWEAGKPLKLEFSTVLSDDQRPCIAIEYNYIKSLK